MSRLGLKSIHLGIQDKNYSPFDDPRGLGGVRAMATAYHSSKVLLQDHVVITFAGRRSQRAAMQAPKFSIEISLRMFADDNLAHR